MREAAPCSEIVGRGRRTPPSAPPPCSDSECRIKHSETLMKKKSSPTKIDLIASLSRGKIKCVIDIFGDTNPRKMPRHLFREAVELDYEGAVKADISRQAPATCPRHWYIPATFVCVDCKEPFLFSVHEQRFWYEERKFFPGVLPVRCTPCRKLERKRKLDEQKPKSKRS